MRNLIRAEIYRYRRSRLFWCMLCAAFLSGAFYGLTVITGGFDDMFIVPLFVIMAFCISLSIGREYSDGTIRNKIIAGKTKTVIFVSKLAISISLSVLMTTVFLIPFAAVTASGVLLQIPASVLLWTALGFYLLNIVWAVMFTFVSMLISSWEIAGILNFILMIAVMFASYQLEFRIGQPEFIENEECVNVPMTPEEVRQVQEETFEGSYSWDEDENGVITYYKSVVTKQSSTPNPYYVPEPFKTVLQSVDSMLPHGQINEYVSCLADYMYRYDVPADSYPRIKVFPLYSLFLIAALSGIGLFLFRKKDLK